MRDYSYVRVERISLGLRRCEILEKLRQLHQQRQDPTSLFLFIYLFAHKTLHTNVTNVQREQDNKAQITGTNRCPLSLDVPNVIVSDLVR